MIWSLVTVSHLCFFDYSLCHSWKLQFCMFHSWIWLCGVSFKHTSMSKWSCSFTNSYWSTVLMLGLSSEIITSNSALFHPLFLPCSLAQKSHALPSQWMEIVIQPAVWVRIFLNFCYHTIIQLAICWTNAGFPLIPACVPPLLRTRFKSPFPPTCSYYFVHLSELHNHSFLEAASSPANKRFSTNVTTYSCFYRVWGMLQTTLF